jgi:solute:Na+ symporter, SSS family
MTLGALDWIIVAAFFALSIGIGAAFTKRGSSSLESYFVAGRKAPWWLAGGAMIATTFAADTPLAVTGLVAAHGVAGNWLWWNMVTSGVLTVFFTARLWRRAGVMTDVELVELRYGGAPARFLRGFRALYLALPINLIILGWVNLAMVKILRITLGIDPLAAMAACFFVTLAYSALSGIWAVLWTDLVQLVVAMLGVTALAVFAVQKVGGMQPLLDGAAAAFGSRDAAVSVLPPLGSAWMPPLALFTFFAVQWWASWYPGAEPGGGGYVAQRIFSAKDEREGVLATLFFQVGHYALRPWPWIVTALATVILYPGGVVVDGKPDVEAAYVQAMVDLMPTGWKGFMLAGFAAAYMSTVATHLNWGASYLVSDVYKRFVRTDADDKHYVQVGRVATVLIFALSLFVTSRMSSIESAWRFLIALGAGTGLVLILRWFWWRINAWTEISAMIASFVASMAAFAFFDDVQDAMRKQALVMLTTVACTTVVWLVVTFATKPEPDDVLRAFWLRVRPGRAGWARFADRDGAAGPGPAPLANFLLGVALVYCALFGIGQVVLGETALGIGLLVVGAACFALIARSLRVAPPPPRS